MPEQICTCKHHVSVHKYDPADEGRAPPKKCGVPGCNCTEFKDQRVAKMEKAERAWQEYLQRERDIHGLDKK